MKWYEVAEDYGDGTCGVSRFRTREEAQAYRDFCESDPNWLCDGDGSPVVEVDTESKWFFLDDDWKKDV